MLWSYEISGNGDGQADVIKTRKTDVYLLSVRINCLDMY